jgi:nitroreductase
MASLNLSVDEVLTTTRSVRKRLDFEKPVPRGVLLECLELAIQAPTGSNQQGWQWVFVEDTEKKQVLADIYRRNFENYHRTPPPRYADGDIRADQRDRVVSSAMYLAEHMHEAPVLLVPCLEGRVDMAPDLSASFWGSLLPAAWSYMLALRSRGLGSTWTTLHLLGEGERQAANLLGIPFDRYSQGGLFPIAYTKGTDFRPAKRLPVEQVVHWYSWDSW